MLTEDGGRSAVTAVQRREWRFEERQRQAQGMARVLDGMARVDPTFRDRCLPAWAILVCALTTFDRVLRRAREAEDFDFSAVPFKGRWGWRRRARLFGYMGRITFKDVN